MGKTKLILGGVFATHTEMDSEGNVTQRDEFHTRLYWDLWHSGAMLKLKGARLHVLLTIAQHADKNGEGFPSIERMASMLPYNKNAINKAIQDLIELGFLQRKQKRKEKGKFGKNHYTIEYTAPKAKPPHPQKGDTDKKPENKGFSPYPKNTDTVKTVDRKQGSKEDTSLKKEQQQTKQPESPSKTEKTKDVVVVEIQNKYKKAFGKNLGKKTAQTIRSLLLKHGKQIDDVISQTITYFKTKGDSPQNPVGALRYAIETGWDIEEVALKKPRREKRNYDRIDPTTLLIQQRMRELAKTGGDQS